MKQPPLFALMAGFTIAASPPMFEDLSSLDLAVANATGAPVGRVGGASGPLDRRLRLARCPETAIIDPPQYDSVAIRCISLGWRIRVPLMVAQRQNFATANTEVIRVRRGDVIDLIYEGEGFAASSSGTAMEDGAEGKIIRVKTSSSASPVNVVVTSAGEGRISH
jgi:flagellar basal body P-ring formation protein FlgA